MTPPFRPKLHSRPKVERILQRYRITPSLCQIAEPESGRLLRIFIEFFMHPADVLAPDQSAACAK
jgi:hypothetical protein